ncbi:hypothetical protein B0T22DRAFT_445880 [Podospora appendiculata]|uniref:Transmembrane protein n=1 Tax=Podospora appendiculata TaxID=314037 RepID=A0AAE0WYV3_9PEZI|nr:hypothetical protein B0T22DRAFT_445880 [Podospora appendiculata]
MTWTTNPAPGPSCPPCVVTCCPCVCPATDMAQLLEILGRMAESQAEIANNTLAVANNEAAVANNTLAIANEVNAAATPAWVSFGSFAMTVASVLVALVAIYLPEGGGGGRTGLLPSARRRRVDGRPCVMQGEVWGSWGGGSKALTMRRSSPMTEAPAVPVEENGAPPQLSPVSSMSSRWAFRVNDAVQRAAQGNPAGAPPLASGTGASGVDVDSEGGAGLGAKRSLEEAW